jgi:hypothetical protein
MRTKAATAVVALIALAATPAALAKSSVTIDAQLIAALHGAPAQLTPVVLKRKDKMRSCQVAAARSRLPGATETERRAATVACEEPALGNLNVASALKSAEAGSLAATG